MDEKYVLVSLEDERTEKLAGVLGNKTCKKILDFLTDKEASESEIAKELKMPLNTVGYNIKNLLLAGLIEEKRHLFSVKGKRIPVYKISNKYIVISPKKSKKISGILPVVVISAIFSIFILYYEKFINATRNFAVEETAPLLQAGEKAAESVGVGVGLGGVEIFLIVIWLIILIFILINLTRRRANSFK